MSISLNEIGIKHKTDKSILCHNYLTFYEQLFHCRKGVETRLLEIGVQFGNSLRTWLEYFEYPVVTGMDAIDNGVEIDRARIIIGDAYSTTGAFLDVMPEEFDIIIEDGDHKLEHQQFVVENYSKLLGYKGILIVEDISEMNNTEFLKRAVPEGFDSATIDLRNGYNVPNNILFLVYRK